MSARRERSAGLTLIELMLALAIGSAALLAAVRLYSAASTVMRTAQSVQALADAGTMALAALRRDVELAGYFGPISADDTLVLEDFKLRSLDVRNDCGKDWATNINEAIGGADNRYDWDCPAYSNSPMPGGDTLILRFAGPRDIDTPQPGRIYLSSSPGSIDEMFIAPAASANARSPAAVTLPLHTRGYYVSTTSIGDRSEPAMPSLRVKHLTQRGGNAIVADDEVQPGIEDLQIEFSAAVGIPAADTDMAAQKAIRTVRIWLLARSPIRENGLGTFTIPSYADRVARSYSDGYRRRLFSTTVAVRNDHPF